MKYQKFSLVFGFSVWLMGTLIVRYWGDSIFQLENNLLLLSLFLGAVPVLYLLAKWVFMRYQLSGDAKLRSTALMAAPGMVCDVICINWHSVVFPALSLEQTVIMASWVIWVYTVVLLVGFIKSMSKSA
ncbi:MAG: DUF5367 domain-containing protein [Cytophagaceae bacterium]|jgi:hypothetical protein|nr:DUF5367 domain-containing protein [Cytophagaceae bacterium]